MHREGSLDVFVFRGSSSFSISVGQGLAPAGPGLHFKLVRVLGVLCGVQSALSESEDSFSEVGKGGVGAFDVFPVLIGHLNFLSVDEDFVASLEDSVRSSLEVDAEVVFNFGGFLDGGVHVSDEGVELNVRAEGNQTLSFFSS